MYVYHVLISSVPLDQRLALYAVVLTRHTSGTDTMECLNDWGLLTEDEIVPMGQLIKSMLMGEDCCPLDQVRRLHYEAKADSVTFIDEDDQEWPYIRNKKKVFHVTGFMVGFIASTGPSTRENCGQDGCRIRLAKGAAGQLSRGPGFSDT